MFFVCCMLMENSMDNLRFASSKDDARVEALVDLLRDKVYLCFFCVEDSSFNLRWSKTDLYVRKRLAMFRGNLS